jgi:hypothetical protein
VSARGTTGVAFPDLSSFRLGAAPMEARSAEALPDKLGRWQFILRDGFRRLAFKESGTVELRGKSSLGRTSRRLWRHCLTSHSSNLSSNLSSTANWSLS